MIRLPLFLFLGVLAGAAPIDREALVRRHNPVVRSVDYDSPLTVGNGGFAFTADITGLQTFAYDYHRHGVPTETQARWAWVSDENPENYTLQDANKDFTLPDGRVLGFPTRSSVPAGDWLRKNPRAFPVGQLQLVWNKPDGSAFTPADIQEPEQTLDLWTGILTSKFKLGGVPVTVVTACAPPHDRGVRVDRVAVKIDSPLIERGELSLLLTFPRGHDINTKNTPALDWAHPEGHVSRLKHGENSNTVERSVGGLEYVVSVSHKNKLKPVGAHRFQVKALEASGRIETTFQFYQGSERMVAPTADVLEASAAHWQKFWRTTAAVDFSGSTNPLAEKFEKRIVLSRYLTAVQSVGDVPPQESGLTCNTWYGKHHTEMIWWHTAQFALWGHDAALAKNLDWFIRQLPAARALAASRGLKGARWAKMTGPEMRESPGGNPLIIWNQPHPIYLAELLYRNSPTPVTLAHYRDLVFETADCLATMAHWNEAKKQYDLGPPLWIAQEIYDQATSQNPSFELAYWRWTLGLAQQWRERLGLPRDEKWDHVIAHLAPIPEKDGKYVALGSHPDTWDNIDSRHDHPTMLAPIGLLPPQAPYTDRPTMERTLDAVLAHWDWAAKIWGWDYPMIAMTAARLGRPETAVEILLRDGPNNIYLPNGHAPVRSDTKVDPGAPAGARKREIAVYLPANGSFLAAAALMIAGWDGNTEEFPGIPKDGTWKVRAEGLKRLP
ncbi:hypothetical protein [Oleiharenicola lentus]|uniref:hypothetical protein n=1 Tax=Oleiharenicola lentus TaxID=2508720 RepID=UPI0013E90AD3|nr:hypothetical protein [Oleiharenicola lentus]